MEPVLLPFIPRERREEPIVVTGLGLITALGLDRETSWKSICAGRSGIGWIQGVRGLPDRTLFGAQVALPDHPDEVNQLKAIRLARRAAAEALQDAQVLSGSVDLDRMGCAISGHMGDTRGMEALLGVTTLSPDDPHPWFEQILPNSACHAIAENWGLRGPRLCHSTACASGLISLLVAVRSIRDQQCDIALAGGGESINALFAAGFHTMRALAEGDDPQAACLPFDQRRHGFVMGEGAAMFVVERLSHALRRNARIYCTIAPGVMTSEAHHVTGLEMDADALTYLMEHALKQSQLEPCDIQYISAHGTGTQQNDAAEIAGINRVFARQLDRIHVSASKSMIGHLVKAAGCAELAITILGLRDGIAPPTIGLEQPDPACRFDCVPRRSIEERFQHALKLSLAFGGHLVGTIVSRWNDPRSGFQYPSRRRAA